MTARTRFCVLFCGTDETQPAKTRLLYSDSDKDDVRLIWRQLYNEEAPINAELIISENCVYRLEDDEDMLVFLAQAEDQYKLLPSQPLKVVLGISAEYFRNRAMSPSVNNNERSTPRGQYSHSPNATQSNCEVATDLSRKRMSIDANSNNNNRHIGSEGIIMSSSPKTKVWSPTLDRKPDIHAKEAKSEPVSPWTATNPLLSLYSRYRGEDREKLDCYKAPVHTSNANYTKTIGGVIDSITSASALMQNPNMHRENGYNGRTEQAQPGYENPYTAYTKHLANTLAAPCMTNPADLNKQKESQDNFPETSTSLTKPSFNLSAYSAFVNTLQEQRLMQNSPSASYILQTIFSNHMRASAQKPDGQNTMPDSRMNQPYIDPKSALGNAFLTPQMLMKSPNHAAPAHPFQDARSSSLLTSLAHQNSNSLLSYMNSMSGQNMHDAKDGNKLEDLIKKSQKKRRRNGTPTENMKPMDSTKRMRSSISQSNIEYHYQRALDYSQMAEEEQKMQNSAHRSHWKHLLFVADRSPKFLERFKHAKYDEWSSEARDIFAICQPDRYMWSFLTLSKQGDLLCKRIMLRIDGLLSKSLPDRPEWCPEDEMLLRAQTRAKERLSQLQRILYSRSMNQEAKAAEKSNNDLEKLSLQEKNLALVTAYHQRQQELLQSHRAMMKHSYHQQMQQQQEEQLRPPVLVANQQSTHCSSLTSSPISMASPAFEENSAGSGCSESPPLRRETDNQSEGSLVIAEEKAPGHSPVTSDDSEAHSISPQPFVQNDAIGLASPHKWVKTEQAADV